MTQEEMIKIIRTAELNKDKLMNLKIDEVYDFLKKETGIKMSRASAYRAAKACGIVFKHTKKAKKQDDHDNAAIVAELKRLSYIVADLNAKLTKLLDEIA